MVTLHRDIMHFNTWRKCTKLMRELLSRKCTIQKNYLRNLTFSEHTTILGIETSCDDTGCAVVDGNGKILGESLYSQSKIHVRYGGVNPLIARDLHRDNIETSVNDALEKANLTLNDIDAIAVTVQPGLLISLEIGVKYAKFLAKTWAKPLIPIHHMEAHALVARMYQNITLPFLALLISGGHCLLTLVKDVDDFLLIGESLDNAPGEVLDKAARRMKLRNFKAYADLPGGKAIETMAKSSNNPYYFKFPLPLAKYRDCNFSFSGLQDTFLHHILRKEEEHNVLGDGIIPEVNDLCAAYQLAIAEHIAHRTERAIIFCNDNNLLNSEHRDLVVSGGVACNDFIFKSIQAIGEKHGCNVYRPPSRLCTDNGVMIAWNAIERVKRNCDTIPFNIDPTAPLGRSYINEVRAANIHVRVTRLRKMNLI